MARMATREELRSIILAAANGDDATANATDAAYAPATESATLVWQMEWDRLAASVRASLPMTQFPIDAHSAQKNAPASATPCTVCDQPTVSGDGVCHVCRVPHVEPLWLRALRWLVR